MDESRTIEVIKRGESREVFSRSKLAAVLWKGMWAAGLGSYDDAREIAHAIEIFLRRRKRWAIESSAIFDMATKSLRRVRMGEAAEMIELHNTLRTVRRRLLRVRHDDGAVTQWDKAWLVELGRRMWHINTETARILAGMTELEILCQQEQTLPRQQIIDEFNIRVAQFGLADAVPVRHFAADA
jgi:hypothetical protein